MIGKKYLGQATILNRKRTNRKSKALLLISCKQCVLACQCQVTLVISDISLQKVLWVGGGGGVSTNYRVNCQSPAQDLRHQENNIINTTQKPYISIFVYKWSTTTWSSCYIDVVLTRQTQSTLETWFPVGFDGRKANNVQIFPI